MKVKSRTKLEWLTSLVISKCKQETRVIACKTARCVTNQFPSHYCSLWNSLPLAVLSGMAHIIICPFLIFRNNNQKDIWAQVYVGLTEIFIKI